MYFLSDEERRMVRGRLLPLARRHEVHAELRGWKWSEPPLSPPYDVPLGVFEIAGKYCQTSRDVYLRRVLGVKAAPSLPMREGATLHRTLVDVVLRAKRLIYDHGTAGCLAALAELETPCRASSATEDVETAIGGYNGAEAESIGGKVAAVWRFEYHRVVGRVQDVLAAQPRVGTDSLVASALPITLEQQLDGSLLGLSPHLSTAAVTAFEPIVFDVKFGQRRDFHRLSTTGYALVLESLFEHPVEVGCVIYAWLDGGRLRVERDLHLIDDELRQWFVEERDERMRMVSEEVDPGKPAECDRGCPYWARCRAG